MTPTAPPARRLTTRDRSLIDRARQQSRLNRVTAIKIHTGEKDILMAYATAFAEAQSLLAELASLAENLGGDDAEPTLHERRMQAVRDRAYLGGDDAS